MAAANPAAIGDARRVLEKPVRIINHLTKA
jgi:hypothetical protein